MDRFLMHRRDIPLSGILVGLLIWGCSDNAKKSTAHTRSLPRKPEKAAAQIKIAQVKKAPPSENSCSLFLNECEESKLEALSTQPVVKIRKGKGGRTLAFKITLADGTSGYYKPEQSFSAAHWYAEIASYYLDRELKLGRVPPTIGRKLPWERLRLNADDDPRIPEIKVQADGTVKGAFIWWIPERLEPIQPPHHWEAGLRNEPLRNSPYRPSAELAHSDDEEMQPPPSAAPQWPDTPDRQAELSDMILFDSLTQNIDRWGTSFTNVRTRGRHGPLIFLDNGAAFPPGQHRTPIMDVRLQALQRFRRSTVEAIRAFDIKKYEARINRDPLAPILTPWFFEGIEIRRKEILNHISTTIERFGAKAIPW